MVLGSGIQDPGSGKNPFRIPDPGVKKAPDPGSGSATLVNLGDPCFIKYKGDQTISVPDFYTIVQVSSK
jgi:hypothetical protein